ncbi:hypothetical protein [Streptomyces sp. G45]|uniref:hypothetical protein n=1 Tax=Streptomyces sp. G45 TaxID=3406627 RepID=UPI003C18534C
MWATEEYGKSHEGWVGAVLADGTEPKPAHIDPGSGPNFRQTREWWAYSGSLGRPRASRARGACSCGWRGENEYLIDWDQVDVRTQEFPSLEPLSDWERHIDSVAALTVPLPTELADLLEQVDTQLTRLADEAPLAAIKAVIALESTMKRVARNSAAYAEADGLSGEALGQALGLSPAAAESRLLRYRLR